MRKIIEAIAAALHGLAGAVAPAPRPALARVYAPVMPERRRRRN